MKRNEQGQFVKVDKIEKNCSYCGQTTQFYPSDIKRGRKYCSKQCAEKHKSEKYRGTKHWRYKRTETQCKHCGEIFEHIPSINRKYCSYSCSGQNQDRDMSGSNNPNWQGGKTKQIKSIRNSDDYTAWRKAVFERDSYTCQECGAKDKFLNAHHIIPMSENIDKALDIGNGKTLCVDCHQQKHPEIDLNLKQSEVNS